MVAAAEQVDQVQHSGSKGMSHSPANNQWHSKTHATVKYIELD
jgi:hypothetical protein